MTALHGPPIVPRSRQFVGIIIAWRLRLTVLVIGFRPIRFQRWSRRELGPHAGIVAFRADVVTVLGGGSVFYGYGPDRRSQAALMGMTQIHIQALRVRRVNSDEFWVPSCLMKRRVTSWGIPCAPTATRLSRGRWHLNGTGRETRARQVPGCAIPRRLPRGEESGDRRYQDTIALPDVERVWWPRRSCGAVIFTMRR